MKWWEIVLDIIQATAPALIVFLTVQALMKEYFKKELNLRMMQQQQDTKETSLPLRLQAYERLTLFCERIKIQNMIMRLQGAAVNAVGLHQSMLIVMKQEYDHNIAQQLYVSEDLWKIITVAQNRTIADISTIAKALPPDASVADLTNLLFDHLDNSEQMPLDIALSAIKKEARLLLA